MRVVEITRPGGPEVLQMASRPVPRPGPGEVCVRVAAAGVNRPDVFQRLGRYAPPPGASDIPGLEVSGTIVAVGPDVSRWRPGDRVVQTGWGVGETRWGCLGERAVLAGGGVTSSWSRSEPRPGGTARPVR